MSGRDDGGRLRPGSPLPRGGPSAADDIIELGSRRIPVFRWRPPRAAVVVGAAALLAGLAVGYAAGILHARKGAPAHSRAPAAALSAPATVAGSLPLSQSGPQCSAQIGHELQLGVQVTNLSAAAAVLRRVQVVLPLGGLKPVSQAWGPCGELPIASLGPDDTLPAGTSAWFTVTFQVLIKCPEPLPVQFTLDYDQRGRSAVVHLPGFADLGPVRYGRCQAGSG
jgi:hypothetical protein